MIDTIYVGMSGLVGYSKGLRVIGNNVTNVNTPGFKGSQLEFADLFYQNTPADGQSGAGSQSLQYGTGLNTLATIINFKQGELQQTGKPLDLAINGDGYFVLRDGQQFRYSRAGQFGFDKDGYLINQTSGAHVQGLNGNGQLADISLGGLQTNPAKATAAVVFNGNISSTASSDVVLDNITVFDSTGAQHALKATFKNNGATAPGSYTITITDRATVVGTGTLQFSNGQIVAGSDKIALNYAPANAVPFPVTLDFSSNVTSFAAGNTSSIAVKSQNGYGAGALTGITFGSDGALTTTYSNGQSTKGVQLALAQFASTVGLSQIGGNEFVNTSAQPPHLGAPQSGSLGAITVGSLENSNVDIATEFSELIVMQRGYQASSHVVSTANDMIQQLFDMKSHR